MTAITLGLDDEGDDYGGLPSLPLASALRRNRKTQALELGDGSVLPRARSAAASVPTNPVEQARILPAAAEAGGQRANFGGLVQGYDKQLDEYRQQLQGLNEPPDYSELAERSRTRGQEGVRTMAASIAAGMGPRDMQHLQQSLAQQSAHQMAPQKVEGGEIDVSGEVRIDPGFKRQKQLETLRESMQALERQKLAAVTAEERYRVEEQQQRIMQEFRQQQLQMQRDAAADRNAIARANLDLRRDIADAKREGGTLNVKDRAQIEDRMGDDFRGETKDLRTELDATRKMSQLPTDRRLNPIEQQSVAVLLNKFLDPGSVVREGEFDRVARAQGLVERAGMLIPKVMSGDFLSPQLVKEIRDMAALYEQASTQRIHGISQSYVERAGRRGLDARNVVGTWMPPEPGAPKAGTPAGSTPAAVKQRASTYYGSPNANP